MRKIVAAAIIAIAATPASAACGETDKLLSQEIEVAGYFCPCAVARGAVFMTPVGAGQEVVCTTPPEALGYPVSGSVTYWIVVTPGGKSLVTLPENAVTN